MNKMKLKYVIDSCLVVFFALLFTTGLIKFPGLLRFLGVPPQAIPFSSYLNTIHDWSGATLGLLILAHLSLNFPWLVSTTKTLLKKQ